MYKSHIMKLSGKVAIVTDGSKGIDKSIAMLFAQHGTDVVITSKDKMNLESTEKEIKNAT
jgi:NAD(P)-dependent dehydrogenase (short-subunit alcohol dehydrogenase family)